MLTRLAVEWSSTLVGMRLVSFRQESGERFRLAFASESNALSLLASIDPLHPWIGEAGKRWEGPRWSPDPFATTTAHALDGRLVTRVVKPPADRTLRVDLGDGGGLVFELAPHGANVILLGGDGTVAASLRSPKGSKERLTPGRPWSERALPAARRDPFGASAAEIDALLSGGATRGEASADTLRREFIGLGQVGVGLAIDEQADSGRSLGSVLRARLDSILEGSAEVVIEGPDGSDDPARSELLPWRPGKVRPGRRLFARERAAATAAHFHEALDAQRRVRARIAALLVILRGELARARSAERKVREGLASFEDPDRFRRMGEALLASLSFAVRSGDVVVVSDPYDPDGRDVVVPAPPGRSLAQVADDLFRRHRRARRGLEAAGARAEALSQRAARMESLLALHERATDGTGADCLEADMRSERLPVGLVAATRSARAAARAVPPRLDGVRLIVSAEGWTILVGRSGPDNDRLTFKIASPDDIWLHAAGVHGAHVIIRNPERAGAAPSATLAEAARLALWFSDARSEAAGDVHWTRRKNVRRAKGGGSGQVVLKRFETIRVRPQSPRDDT